MFGGATGLISGGIKGTIEWQSQKGGNYKVYKGIDGDDGIRYVGITKQDPVDRFNQHLKSKTNRAKLNYKVISKNLPKAEARRMEQNMINKLGLQKNGGQFFIKTDIL